MKLLKLVGAIFCSLLSLFSVFIAWALYRADEQGGATKFLLIAATGAGLAVSFAKQVKKQKVNSPTDDFKASS
jgi:hypothetical protein